MSQENGRCDFCREELPAGAISKDRKFCICDNCIFTLPAKRVYDVLVKLDKRVVALEEKMKAMKDDGK